MAYIKEKATFHQINNYLFYTVNEYFNPDGTILKSKKRYHVWWRNVAKRLIPRHFWSGEGGRVLPLHYMYNSSIGAIAIDDEQDAISAGDPSVTLTTSTDDVLVACIGIHQGSVNSVKWNGTAITQGPSAATAFNERAQIWYDTTPEIGTYTLLFDGTTGGGRGVAGYVLSGVKTTGQPNKTGTNTGTDASIESAAVTPDSNGAIIIDSVYTEATLNSAGSNQTIQANLVSASYQNFGSSSYIQATAASQTHTWALASSQRWASAIIVFEEAGGVSTVVKDMIGSGFIPFAR